LSRAGAAEAERRPAAMGRNIGWNDQLSDSCAAELAAKKTLSFR
jgi:hypothetical protein